MGLLNYFFKEGQPVKRGSAQAAKERLQIIVATTGENISPAYLPALRRELLEVVRKYVNISDKDMSCEFNDDVGDGVSVLEVNVTLPSQK
jgi:cell division topological specificity factor